MPRPFDCFSSHNSSDKLAVRALNQALSARGLTCWLDEEQLRPGLPWQPMLEAGIRDSDAVTVCIASDGIGPWQDLEMQAALQLAARDASLPVMAVMLPGAPSQPKLPTFLSIRGWVDLRGGISNEGLAQLIWGITGERPTPVGGVRPRAHAANIPGETRFLDQVFDALYSEPTLVLLAQQGRNLGSATDALRARAEERFSSDRVLRLTPPRGTEVDDRRFFTKLAKRAGLAGDIDSADAFADQLEDLLDEDLDAELFLLITGLAQSAESGRRLLAGLLRDLSEVHGARLKVVLIGEEELAELTYADGRLSLLNHALPLPWPELTSGDLVRIAAGYRLQTPLEPEEATELLDACGGDPRLVADAP